MFFRQLFDKESSTLTYVIADLKSSEAAIIDPVKSEIETYITLLAEYGLLGMYLCVSVKACLLYTSPSPRDRG